MPCNILNSPKEKAMCSILFYKPFCCQIQPLHRPTMANAPPPPTRPATPPPSSPGHIPAPPPCQKVFFRLTSPYPTAPKPQSPTPKSCYYTLQSASPPPHPSKANPNTNSIQMQPPSPNSLPTTHPPLPPMRIRHAANPSYLFDPQPSPTHPKTTSRLRYLHQSHFNARKQK